MQSKTVSSWGLLLVCCLFALAAFGLAAFGFTAFASAGLFSAATAFLGLTASVTLGLLAAFLAAGLTFLGLFFAVTDFSAALAGFLAAGFLDLTTVGFFPP